MCIRDRTTLFLSVIRRLECERCIVLSFSRTAVKVARVRLVQETGQWLQTQTFDSLFLHLHGHRAREKHSEPTFQTYRDMVVETSEEDLEEFKCRTRNLDYVFKDIDYVFVDEAQDSPPEAYDFLNLCRNLGKHVIVAGDRRQAIFRFLNTASLFDAIPNCYTVRHQLTITRRCIQQLCNYVNTRFGTNMKSRRTLGFPDNKFVETSIQCRLNSTMGQLYVTLLSTLSVRVTANTAEGSSYETFYNSAILEIEQKYGVQREKAQQILDYMEERTKCCRGSPIVLSTIHRYKGDESDVSIIAPDLDIDMVSDDIYEENLKYVACTRARYGLLFTLEPAYVGNPRPLELLAERLGKNLYHVGVNSVSQSVTSPVVLIRMLGDPRLRRVVQEAVQAYRSREAIWGPATVHSHPPNCKTSAACATLVGSACDVAIAWATEQKALCSGVVNTVVNYPELRTSIHDDRKLRATFKQKLIDQSLIKKYKGKLLHSKLVAILCRYLVVRHGYELHSPMIAVGAFHCALLQNFAFTKSVRSLRREIPMCCIADYRNLLKHCMDNLPPVLRDSQEWQAVVIHGSLPDVPLVLRGTFDIMVYDKASKRHIVEVKCVRHLKFVNFWQSMMYAVVCHVNSGVEVHHTHVWSMRDNAMYTVPTKHIKTMAQELTAHAGIFNTAVCCRPDPQFYPKLYDPSELVLEN